MTRHFGQELVTPSSLTGTAYKQSRIFISTAPIGFIMPHGI